MKRVGFVGWRGMVGSVLMDRMREERDFDHQLSELWTHLSGFGYQVYSIDIRGDNLLVHLQYGVGSLES